MPPPRFRRILLHRTTQEQRNNEPKSNEIWYNMLHFLNNNLAIAYTMILTNMIEAPEGTSNQ